MKVKAPTPVNVPPGGTQSHVMITQYRKAPQIATRPNVSLNLDGKPTSRSNPSQQMRARFHCSYGLHAREFPQV